MKISICQAGSGIIAAYRNWISVLFRDHGHDPVPMPARGTVASLGDLVFSMNFIPDLARLAKRLRKPYVCWLCDPLVNYDLLNPDWVSDYTLMFHFSRGDMAAFRAAGYRHLYYLPLSIDDRALRESARAAAGFAYAVSFVGNCYVPEKVSAYRKYREAYQAAGFDPALGLTTLEQFLDVAATDIVTPLKPLFRDHVRQTQADFFDVAPMHARSQHTANPTRLLNYFVDFILCHEIDTRVRRTLIKAMAPLGVDLWGDAEGWRPVTGNGVSMHGHADMTADLGRIVTESRICLNIRRRITDGANMRTFEIPACGGFQLALFSDELAGFFEPEREVACFRTIEEAHDKAAFYLVHESARQAIAAAGRERFYRDHTLKSRFMRLAGVLQSLGL